MIENLAEIGAYVAERYAVAAFRSFKRTGLAPCVDPTFDEMREFASIYGDDLDCLQLDMMTDCAIAALRKLPIYQRFGKEAA